MPWFKVDDGLAFSLKAVAAGNGAMGLWVRAGSWSMQQLSDGFVPAPMVLALGGATADAEALVAAGLWEMAAGGYQFLTDGVCSFVHTSSRPYIPEAIRHEVYERDGYSCVFCGATSMLSLDHVIRYRDGGPDTVDNLRVLCMPCNLERG